MNTKNLIFSIIDFLFPSRCVNCDTLVSYKDSYLCSICFSKIKYLSRKCEKCNSTLVDEYCNICSDRKLFIEANIIMAEYTDVMREILHNYKFEKKRRLKKILSQIALRGISGFINSIDIIIPVPINRNKKWKRGFNQSELIAKEISKKIKKNYKSVLKERYHFKTQKNLGYRDRFLNILDRYEVKNSKSIINKNIILLDDIFTTGATINECARVLKSFGASKVYSLTIAGAHIKRVDK